MSVAVVHRMAVLVLAFTAACLPLYVVRFHIGPLPTTLLEVLIAFTVAAYVLVLWSERRLPRARTPIDIPIALLLVAGILGIVAAPDHLRGAGIYRAYFVEAIAMYFITVDLLRAPEDIRTFLLVAAAGGCVMAVGQIVSFVYVAAYGHLQLGDAPSFLNTTPNADAMYLEPPLAFAAGFALFPSRPRERLVAGPMLALTFVAMLLTLSRASYLAMAVLAAVIVLSLQSWRWRLRAAAAVAIVTLVVVEIPFINHRLIDIAHSATNRSSLYRTALEMLFRRPILGAGFDGFPVRVAPFRPANQSIQLYPHDLWLTTWSEIGLLGVVAFTIILFGLMWLGARALPRSTGVYRPLMWGAVGALTLIAVHGLFDSPYWKNDLSVEFWLVAALLVVGLRAVRARTAGAADAERPPGP